ncbi:hypothetical protein CYLTODRAFT_294124 [Cylindrobasidium torrendii FP15055 ss-10]|uniref:DUF6533 domain-containing protein n=1 Tax=Cylindrobasidium torrendii FP15055 ss-10 TaxID=1314674 RepID=A0A0D7BA19_9AGAR|nr:hypothetical protein CYLTODRAFT_294124 [Cylindrobasidium torrendii FP15055 ss-10]
MSSESAVDLFMHIRATRYLSAAGLVVLLYDHVLLLADEVEYVWKARWSATKVGFLWLRYAVPASVIMHTYQIAGMGNGDLTDKVCQTLFDISLVIGQITIFIGNLLVLRHLWNLWHHKTLIVWGSLALLAATFITSLVCTGVTISNMNAALYFDKSLGLCAVSRRGQIPLLWGPGLAFEIAALVMLVYNALERPRGKHTAVTWILYRDGFAYFLILFGLRLCNLLLAIFAPVSLIFLAVFFIWCATTVTVSRFTLNQSRMEILQRSRILAGKDFIAFI